MQKYKNIWLIQSLVFLILMFLISANSYAQINVSSPVESSSALLVDISKYKDSGIAQLKSKGRGIYEIKEALNLAGGYPDNQIQIMLSESATREGIIEALTRTIKNISAKENVQFFFYLKSRYIKIQNETYLLPYDARIGATSTYIKLSELLDIWDKIALSKGSVKAYIWTTWDMNYKDEESFTSNLAKTLLDEQTDADGNRNITFREIINKHKQIGEPQIFAGSNMEASALISLPSIVEVDSKPPGANVFIDDANKGTTPAKIMGLTHGEHRLLVRKDLYRQSEERIFNLYSTRGQKIGIMQYLLIPIRILGTVLDTNQNPITDAEVWIENTPYRQKVSDDGKFAFVSSQLLDSLEQDKTYNIIVRSSNDIYYGKTSFVFRGMEDINLNIPMAQRDWLGLAQQRLAEDDTKGALDILDSMLQTSGSINEERFRNIQKPLALFFIDELGKRIQSEPNNLKFHFTLAILSDTIGETGQAKRYWKMVKKIAPRDSNEYRLATVYLGDLSLIRHHWLTPIIFIIIIAFLVGFVILSRYFIIKMRFRKFREIPNPYVAGKPISEPNMFFGREDIFAFIKDRFNREAKDITIVLHGGRRTGKTSIMYQIANGRLGQDFVPVFIDMQEMAGVDAHDFFRSIAQKVDSIHKQYQDISEDDRKNLNELLKNLDDKSKTAYQSFNKYITTVASMLKDKYIIFLIDEYEIIERKVNDEDLSDEIFSYLRHLMQNINNLAFIFSGSSDFKRRERKEWSLTFNMAQPKEVSFLSNENTVSLITKPVKDYVQYSKKAIERILRLTAGHPFFTQAICLQIIEQLNETKHNKVNIEQVQHACNEIVENAPFHLSFVWNELSNNEKILIAMIADTIQDDSSYVLPDEIISKMPNYGVKFELSDFNKALIRLIEGHLIEKKPESDLYRFQMDLVREWMRVEHPIWGVLREVGRNE